MTCTMTSFTKTEDSSLGMGVAGIKEKMSKLKSRTDELNAYSQRLENEKEIKDQDCIIASRKQMELLMKCRETESAMRRTEDKLKSIVQQVRDAELFLEESEKFQSFLTTSSSNQDEITKLTEKLERCKDIFSQNEKKCRKAEKRKVKLTRQYEAANHRLKEALCKRDALKLELEYGHIDEARKSESCAKQVQIAAEYKEKFLKLESAIEMVTNRRSDACARTTALRSRIREIERHTEELRKHRTAMQLKTRELVCAYGYSSRKK